MCNSGFRRKMRELIKTECALTYDDKARLFALMAWNGPEAAWKHYKELEQVNTLTNNQQQETAKWTNSA